MSTKEIIKRLIGPLLIGNIIGFTVGTAVTQQQQQQSTMQQLINLIMQLLPIFIILLLFQMF